MHLPGVGPVFLVDDPRLELADRSQAERLEVTERAARRRHGVLGGHPVASGHVRPDDGRPADIYLGAETLVDEDERRLDRGPTRCNPGQDLAHRFDRLVVGRDRQLEPGALGRGTVVVVGGRQRLRLGGGRHRRVASGHHVKASFIRSRMPPPLP